MYSQPSYNAVSEYHVVWKPRQANSYGFYGNRAIRYLEFVQITSFVPCYIKANKYKTQDKL